MNVKQAYIQYKLDPIKKSVFGILCLDCGWVGISWNRHDYKTCNCPQDTMIDGGQIDYHRYGGKSFDRLQLIEIKPIKKAKKK